ncbi:SCO7613 C-terminal domain-containing membrane protein [Plantactinospora sp. WMMB782]|uniref:SCO7613 C-terminal domain-containing membrane protein n=1 Tax=Plantactinospora sp. WMMB782 TaxID=3404121 RepID=UPI003B940A39
MTASVNPNPTAYPCPVCGAGADLATGCPGCGRGPDPAAAEVVRLGAEIAALAGRVEQARRAYLGLDATLWQLRRRRDALAEQVRAAAAAAVQGPAKSSPGAPAAVSGPAGTPGPQASAPVRPEASTRTVQNVLFILGGLLVGTAAVVFTVVAWATVGVGGRALILGVLTGLALAAPLLARRRGLTATAETFAAIGLLLVVLDGYAGWAVDLFGVAGWPTVRYAALVLGVGAVVAGGYHRLTRLAAPAFAGLLLLQPVVPLLAYDAGFGAAGWTVALAGLAAVNLILTRGRGGDGPADPVIVVRRSVAWVGYGLAGLASALCGTLAVVTTDGPLAVFAGVPLLVAALLPIAGAVRLRSTAVGAGAAALFVVVLAVALVRAAAEASWPLLLPAAVIVALLAAAVTATARLLPAGIRLGPRAGGLVVAGALAVLTGSMALVVALAVAARSQPAWRAELTARSGPFDWQLPVALLLAAGALAVLGRRRDRSLVAIVAATLTVLAAPAGLALPWCLVATQDLVAAGILALVAAWPHRGRRPVLPAAVAAVPLAGHALLVGLARPAGAAAVCGALVLLGVAVALAALRRPAPTTPPATDAAAPAPAPTAAPAVGGGRAVDGRAVPAGTALRRVVGGTGLAVAVLAAPATVLLGLFAAGAPSWWQARAVLAAAVLLAAGLVPVRRATPHYRPYANAALSTVALAVGLAPGLPGVGEPAGPYAAGALLLTLGVWLAGRGRPARSTGPDQWPSPAGVPALVSGAVLLVRAAVVAVPAVLVVLVAPYAWLGRIWSGPPAGVGLAPVGTGPVDWRLDTADGLTLLLLTVAAAVAGWARRRTVRAAAVAAAPLAVGTALVGLAVAGAPWPVVPASSLLAGAAGLLALALRPGTAPAVASRGGAASAVEPEGGVASVAAAGGSAVSVAAAAGTTASVAAAGGRTASAVMSGGGVGWRRWPVPVGVGFAAAGLAGLLPTRAGTLAGLALVGVAGLAAGARGGTSAARVAGWLTGVAGTASLAATAAVAADLPLRLTALAVLGVAALALAGAALLAGPLPGTPGPAGVPDPAGASGGAGTSGGAGASGGAGTSARAGASVSADPSGRADTTDPTGRSAPVGGRRWVVGWSERRVEAVAVEAASHVTAAIALLLSVGEIRYAAAVCTLWGVALGLRALRPGEPAPHRWARAAAAGGAELVAAWLLLASARVALVEAYTLPAAVLGLLAGWLALRAWPALSSWVAYGPGLGAALLPSLVSVVVAADQPWRRLLLGAGALAAVLVGARWRRQAPVLLGGAVLAVLAVREMVDVWDLLPRWIFLAVGGFALIGLAMTYERRRRDLRRLRAAVHRMS